MTFDKLNITDGVLDALGFSDYWDEDGDWGSRILDFENGTRFRIAEMCETDENHEGKYIANHYWFAGWYASPKISIGNPDDTDLFFLHEMYECIAKFYPKCLPEFTCRCNKVKMISYIEGYLKWGMTINITEL